MRTHVFAIALLAALTVGTTGHAQPSSRSLPRAPTLTVMTWNVSNGVDAELAAVPSATGLPDLLQRVAWVYQTYIARNFADRAAAMAARIREHRPDLIGIQEAVLVRTQTPADGPATPATTVELDYVQILLDALEAQGLRYEVVVQSINFDAELPSALGFDVRHTDRDVILARVDAGASDLSFSNAQGGVFASNCAVPSATLGPTTFRRGWASVDVKLRQRTFRFVSTHLEGACLQATPGIQRAQALELLGGPASTSLPLILVGDLNSAGDGTGAAYSKLMGAGFNDVAVAAGVGNSLTCCQAPDLSNPQSLFDRRIDFVLLRGHVQVLGMKLIGEQAADRTASGRWPSDHAGLVARLRLVP